MKTLMIAVALVLSFSTTAFAQRETIFLGELTINSCESDVCVNLTATLHPTESLLAYLVYDRLTGTPIIPPVTIYENLPTGALVINKQGHRGDARHGWNRADVASHRGCVNDEPRYDCPTRIRSGCPAIFV